MTTIIINGHEKSKLYITGFSVSAASAVYRYEITNDQSSKRDAKFQSKNPDGLVKIGFEPPAQSSSQNQ